MKKSYPLVIISYPALMMTLASCGNADEKKRAEDNDSQIQQTKVEINYSDYSGKIKDAVTCDSDVSLSYCLYLPADYSSGKKFPVIFIFDAHGEGNLPVNKYKSLAEEFGIVLAASNNSKNGLPYDAIQRIASAMIVDAQKKLTLDSARRFTMGFSGGARVAGFIASHERNFAGAIGCGAEYLDEAMKNIPGFFCFGFAGNDDFNMLEMLRSQEHMANTGLKNYFFVFDGRHEWPDSSLMRNAFMMMSSVEAKQKEALRKKIAASVPAKFSQKKIFADEEMKQKKFIDAFTAENIQWWKNEIATLNLCGRDNNRDRESMHSCRRQLAYIGLAIYSYSNNAINNHQDAFAQKYLEIYRLADEKNSEQRFMEAVLKSRQGNNSAAIILLAEAVHLGFNDFSRIENHPDLQNLKGLEGYAQIFSGIKPQP